MITASCEPRAPYWRQEMLLSRNASGASLILQTCVIRMTFLLYPGPSDRTPCPRSILSIPVHFSSFPRVFQLAVSKSQLRRVTELLTKNVLPNATITDRHSAYSMDLNVLRCVFSSTLPSLLASKWHNRRNVITAHLIQLPPNILERFFHCKVSLSV